MASARTISSSCPPAMYWKSAREQAKVSGRVPVGAILVDGLGVGDVGNVVLRDRQHLAEDGIMIVVMSLDRASGELVAGPDIVSRGFVYVKESDELIEEARRTVDDALQACLDKGITDWGKLKTTTKDVLGDYVWKKTKRRPMILPIISGSVILAIAGKVVSR
ncbi:MAG: hypothetical protein ACLR6I_15140 [Waltera sp.]